MGQLSLFQKSDRNLIKYESPYLCKKKIIDQYCSLIQNGVSTSEILLLTYSSQQADFLYEDIIKKIDTSVDENWIVSFSTFAWRIINEHGFEGGINVVPEKISRTALQIYISKLISKNKYCDFFLDNHESAYFLNMVVESFDWLALNDISFNLYDEYFYRDEDIVNALCSLYKDYKQGLLSSDLADDNIITDICLNMLSEKKICNYVSSKYKYVIVDKLEEVNYHHFRIIKKLFLDTKTPIKIYYNDKLLRRGRNKELFNRIKEEAQYILNSTDDCTPSTCILNLSEVNVCNTIDDELKFCLDKIHSLILERGTYWKDIVLSAVDESKYYEKIKYYLQEQDVPFVSFYSKNAFDSNAANYLKDLIKYLEKPTDYLFKKIAVLSETISHQEYMKIEYELDKTIFVTLKTNKYELLKDLINNKPLLNLYFSLLKTAKFIKESDSYCSSLKIIVDSYLSSFIKKNDVSANDGSSLNFIYSIIKDYDKINVLLGIESESDFYSTFFALTNMYGHFYKQTNNEKDCVRFIPYISLKTEQYKHLILLGADDHSLPGKQSSNSNVLLDKLFTNLKISIERIVPPFISNNSIIETEKGTLLSAVLNTTGNVSVSFSKSDGDNEYDVSPFLADSKQIFYDKKSFIDIFSLNDPKKNNKNLYSKIEVTSKTYTASAIKKYLSCPRQYYYSKLLKINPGKKDEMLFIGNEVHHVLQKLHRIFPYIKDVDKNTFIRTAFRLIEREWYGYELSRTYSDERLKKLALKGSSESFGVGTIASYYYESICQIINDYCDQIYLDNLDRKSIYQEKKIKFKIGKYSFYGEIDRVDRDNNGSLFIIDYKTQNTAAKTAKTEKVKYLSNNDELWKATDFQLPLYYMGAKKIFDAQISSVDYYYLKQKKANRKFINVSIVFNQEDDDKNNIISISDDEMIEIENNIIDVLNKMENGNFLPEPETSMVCKYCDYSEVCSEVNLS